MALNIIRALIFVSLVITGWLIVVTLERCRSEKRFNFIYCLAGIIFYNLGYLIEMTSGNTGGGIIAVKVMYVGACFMPAFFLFFVADYCELKVKKRFFKIPALVLSALNYLVVATFDHHSLMYAGYRYDPLHPMKGMEVTPGPLYYLTTIFSLVYIVITCTILIREILRNPNSRTSLILILAASLAPVLAQLFYLFMSFAVSVENLSGINFTAFVMVAINVVVYFTIIKNDLFDLAPKAYSITLDLIRDAFVVLDRDMRYSFSNEKARLLFPGLKDFSKGSPITSLEGWPAELAVPDKAELSAAADGESRASVNREKQFVLPGRPDSSYSGWVNAVTGENRNAPRSSGREIAGWVVLIQDITETVKLFNNIQSQRDEIAAMRDNLKEGLFLMDRNCRIQPSYSKALEDVLSLAGIQGKDFIALLKGSFNGKELGTVRDYFGMIFDASVEAELIEDINPLQEFRYTSVETGINKTLRALFAPVDRGKDGIFVLGTFQDVTEEVKLRERLAEEESRRQEEMRAVYELLQVDRQVFDNFIEDTEYEFERVNGLLKENKLAPRDLVVNIYQSVHAIKSNALVVGLASYGERLHRLETEIKEIRGRDAISVDDILHIAVEFEKRMKDKDRFLDLIGRITAFTSGSAGAKTGTDVFVSSLRRACERAAEDLGKKARFIIESFDPAALSPGRRRVMQEILIQLARNAVSHGIETPEERKAKGKDETGTVSLCAAVENGTVLLVLKDDGRGLDFRAIAEKALERGFIGKGDDKADKRLLLNVLFMPGFSTSKTENMHSGRGIGLNLVRDRLKDLNGTIRIQNNPGGGLAFDIRLPADAVTQG